MTIKVVAICGLMRSGKDVVARYISNKWNFEHVKISDKLKQSLKILFDFTDEQLEGNQKDHIDPKWSIAPRQVMQFIGTEIMQYKIQEIMPSCNRTFWIQSLVSAMQTESNVNYVISDLRFLHEVHYLQKVFGDQLLIVKIVRPQNNIENEHCSEKEFIQIKEDILIVNDNGLEKLYQQIDGKLSQKLLHADPAIN